MLPLKRKLRSIWNVSSEVSTVDLGMREERDCLLTPIRFQAARIPQLRLLNRERYETVANRTSRLLVFF